MKIQATINLLGETRRGTSIATGNEWMQKEAVIEWNEDNYTHTMAVSTFMKDVIEKLDNMSEGDEVSVNISFRSKARTFTTKDGRDAIIRNTECILTDVEPAAF